MRLSSAQYPRLVHVRAEWQQPPGSSGRASGGNSNSSSSSSKGSERKGGWALKTKAELVLGLS